MGRRRRPTRKVRERITAKKEKHRPPHYTATELIMAAVGIAVLILIVGIVISEFFE